MTTWRELLMGPGRRLLAVAVAGMLRCTDLRAEGAAPQAFDLPAGAAEATLLKFSVQSGRQVIFPTDVVKGIPTRAVKGELTAGDALEAMLRDTALVATMDTKTEVFAIVRRGTAAFVPARLGTHGLVVVGLTADEDQAARMQLEATHARDGFLARGVPADAITVFGTDETPGARKAEVLAALQGLRPPIAETWLVFLGQVASSRDGKPAFQVRGPRLTADELAAALGAVPGKKYVVLAAGGSGGFLPPLLALPQVEAVAATAESGEINEPRFSEFWLSRFQSSPDTGFRELAVAASGEVEAYCKEHEIALGEHARLIDHPSGKILEAPFTAPSASPKP